MGMDTDMLDLAGLFAESHLTYADRLHDDSITSAHGYFTSTYFTLSSLVSLRLLPAARCSEHSILSTHTITT
jgi:hypothetical protein